jgi:membrane-associated phospholipid phosphatase
MDAHAYTATALRTQRPPPPARRSSPATALAICALCVLGLALVWGIAEHSYTAQLKDAAVLRELTRLNHGALHSIAGFMIRLLDSGLYILWGIALVAFAIAQERPRVAMAVVALLGLAPLSAEALKPLLAHSHLTYGEVSVGPASWPSGHTTAAAALALGAVLVAPARLRPLVGVFAAAFAAAVGLSLLIHGAHMPSDVLGGYLVAGFWTALVVAALRSSDSRPAAPA